MRLDVYLVQKKYFDSRTKARQAIERGEIYLAGKAVYKPAFEIDETSLNDVEIIAKSSFVSLGGYKMEKALNDFNYSVKDFIVADIGASTGGFTDCLIQRGAKKVYAVDLNDGLLHDKLKKDDRIISVIKNARQLEKKDFDEKIDLLVADLSFISISYVLEIFSKLLDDESCAIILIKPQFETGERKKFKNGIIRDEKLHRDICQRIFNECKNLNLIPINYTKAPEVDDKNLEFLVLLEKNSKKIPVEFM